MLLKNRKVFISLLFEDWGEPILKEYIKDNDEYSLEELESMSFYKYHID